MEDKRTNVLDKDIMSNFPKVELHRHLEGTFSLKTLYKIALNNKKKNKLDCPEDWEQFKHYVQFPKESEPDFQKFLSKFKNNWYQSFDDIRDITYYSVRDFTKESLFYIELRFSPEHFAVYNNFDRNEVTKTIIDAADAAAKKEGIDIRYLITLNRGKQHQTDMIKLYKQLSKLKLDRVVGIDLAGDEVNNPPEKFADFFDYVKKEQHHRVTIHAGEVTEPEQIWASIKLLHADRIGHGTSTIKDPELQSYLKEHNIILEQCITSNFQTGSWSNEATHPLYKLYKKNVPVTINSDDPTIQDTDLTDDYIKCIKHFSLGISDFVKLNEIALNGAFLSEPEKQDLLNRYHAKISSFKKKYKIE